MTSSLAIMDNITWCKGNKLGINSLRSYFIAADIWNTGYALLHWEISNFKIQIAPMQSVVYSIYLHQVNVSLSGTNSLSNSGASKNCIRVENSNLTISGNFTVKEHSLLFGIIYLQGLSILFL